MGSSTGSLETSGNSYPSSSFASQFMDFIKTSPNSTTSTSRQLLGASPDDDSGSRPTTSSGHALSDRFGSRSGGGGVPKFKSAPPPSLPISPPPASPFSYFSIPPGLSPAELLDSPVLLATNVLPSPTTGTFPLQFNWRNGSGDPHQQQRTKEEEKAGFDFSFEPDTKPSVAPSSIFHSSASLSTDVHPLKGQQLLWNYQEYDQKSEFAGFQSADRSNQASTQASQPLKDQRRSSDDGYNWRKYGQKQVKGSENPRSYYKCTFPSCPTKKKVEKSLEGEITEIVYKGTHNHPKPQSVRRTSSSSATAAVASSQGNTAADGLQLLPAPSEESSASLGDDDFEKSSQLSRSVGDEFDEEGPDAKRWKECDQSEGLSAGSGNRTVREPRVVVQTTSDIDILDDGYRWRKYGQKVVKGNPNPRSYYKCTTLGCPVRKHVERASQDLRSVITTYEGKHNHTVPAARGSAHRPAQSSADENPSSGAVKPLPSIGSTTHMLSSHGHFGGRLPPLQAMQQSAGSFGFPGFPSGSPAGSYMSLLQQEDTGMLGKAKEEPRDDLFVDSLLC